MNAYVGAAQGNPIEPAQNALVQTPAQQLQALPPEPPKPISHDVTIVTTRKLARARALGVPPEEFGIERAARDIKTCNYCFHEVVTKTRAQLIAEGFDEDQINAITTWTGQAPTAVEVQARDSVHESYWTSSDINTAAQPVKITEHYVRMDYRGDGRPCLYMVVTGGDLGDVLKKDGKEVIEPVDVIPFAATTPVPITHRFFGRSIADLVMPAQREKTALKRGALDNLYLHNNPRVEVAEQNAGPNTLDDLLVSRPGGVVRTKTPGGLNWQTVPDITPSIYPMMNYIDAELEARTGLAKQTQGIDANALQNQSATAVAQVFSASQMRIKLVARIMAEGVRDIFSLLHHTIRSHGQEKQTVRLRNKWVPVDPRAWKTRDDMTIHVGLGSGGKAQQFAQVMALGNVQKELLAGGKSNLVGDRELYNTAAELTRIMGHKNPDQFFNDPTAKKPDGSLKNPPVPPPPDPKVQIEQMKAQGQAQLEQQKQQHTMQVEQGKGQLELFKTQAKAQQDADKAKLDAMHQQMKTEAEIELARQKAQLETEKAVIDAQLKKELAQIEAQMKQQNMAHQQATHQHEMAMKQMEMAHANSQHQQKMQHVQSAHESKMKQGEAKAKAKSAPKPQAPKAEKPAGSPVDDAVKILEAVAKVQKPKKVIRDDKGQVTGIE